MNYDLVVKLRIALSSVYWFKNDMINMINTYTSEWVGFDRKNKYSKYELATQVLQRLWRDEKYEEIDDLILQVLAVNDFSHFDKIENGETLKIKAITSVQNLKICYQENK